jgi:hypothetical protein
VGWLSIGLGCLWDWAQNILAIKYLSRSLAGCLLLLLFWGSWAGLVWWLFNDLQWYWALLIGAALWLIGNIGAGIYALRELQNSKSYQAATDWVSRHPWLEMISRKRME